EADEVLRRLMAGRGHRDVEERAVVDLDQAQVEVVVERDQACGGTFLLAVRLTGPVEAQGPQPLHFAGVAAGVEEHVGAAEDPALPCVVAMMVPEAPWLLMRTAARAGSAAGANADADGT